MIQIVFALIYQKKNQLNKKWNEDMIKMNIQCFNKKH